MRRVGILAGAALVLAALVVVFVLSCNTVRPPQPGTTPTVPVSPTHIIMPTVPVTITPENGNG